MTLHHWLEVKARLEYLVIVWMIIWLWFTGHQEAFEVMGEIDRHIMWFLLEVMVVADWWEFKKNHEEELTLQQSWE